MNIFRFKNKEFSYFACLFLILNTFILNIKSGPCFSKPQQVHPQLSNDQLIDQLAQQIEKIFVDKKIISEVKKNKQKTVIVKKLVSPKSGKVLFKKPVLADIYKKRTEDNNLQHKTVSASIANNPTFQIIFPQLTQKFASMLFDWIYGYYLMHPETQTQLKRNHIKIIRERLNDIYEIETQRGLKECDVHQKEKYSLPNIDL